jgi:hypothetical protein
VRLLKKSWPLVLCLCCGRAPEQAVTPEPSPIPPCQSCQVQQPAPSSQSGIEKQLYVVATPRTLMFYADLDQTIDQQTIHIVNHTAVSVLIRNVSIVDVPDRAWAQGDAIYFALVNDVTAEILEPSEQVQIAVEFIGGTKQRTALLRIETSSIQDPILQVELQGKLFTGW